MGPRRAEPKAEGHDTNILTPTMIAKEHHLLTLQYLALTPEPQTSYVLTKSPEDYLEESAAQAFIPVKKARQGLSGEALERQLKKRQLREAFKTKRK